jgi:ureidoglycolate dehydrogenase (NAD+)
MKTTAEKLTRIVAEIFMKKGLDEKKAYMVAEPLVAANQRGVDSHGVMRAAHYIIRDELGGSHMLAEPSIVSETPVSAVMDAHAGLGAYASRLAVELAREKAAQAGIGCVLVRNSNHYGAAAYWAEMLAGEDMLGFTCTNTEPSMIAPGAREATVGNSPFSIAVPATAHPGICVDMATSEAAFGKIMDYKARGLSIPFGWAVDRDGQPTRDPAAAFSLLPFGMHKGYGISVIIDVLTGILAGGKYGAGVNKIYAEQEKPQEVSHFFLATRIDLFRDLQDFKADVDDYIDQIHMTPAAEGKTIFMPGEIEYLKKQRSLEEGIVLPDTVANDILAMAEKLGVDCAGCFE